jgi:hypothetical protein
MNTTRITGSAAVLVAVCIGASPASAVCNPPKFVSTYNFVTGAYAYWHSSLIPLPNVLNAKIWSGGVDHTGTCNQDPGILYFGAAPGDMGINLSLGHACVPGCPLGSLSIQASATNGRRSETLVAKTNETPAGAVNFDFSQTGSRALGELPRPRVTSSSRVGTQIQLTLSIAGISVFDGAEADVMGFNVLGAQSIVDPGRSASPYALLVDVPSPGGTGGTATVLVPFPGTTSYWIVTQVVTRAGPSDLVSEATRISGQILAEPTRKPKNSMTTRTEN